MSLSLFTPESTDFSVDHLNFFVQLSKTAYSNEQAMLATLKEHSIDIPFSDIFIENNDTDTQCFVFSYQTHIFIIFRGSEAKAVDWKTNFTYKKMPWPYHEAKGEVHSGFYNAVDSVWEKINSKVEREIKRIHENNEVANLWFSGHSLGGGLAQLACTRFLLTGLPENVVIRESYVFAAPRFASKKLANYITQKFGQTIYRVVKNGDLVPRTPHRFAGYKNAFTLKFFNNQEQLISATDFSVLNKLSHYFSDVILFTQYAIGLVPIINVFLFKNVGKKHSIFEYERLCLQLKEKFNRH
ncbi:lipase family protein [Marinicellulosiphila megalodicopiae]|uniref:lipase family protein n=1 Tax=Marinicellulosiphila megalodicopiae TaxID=2724896 RepID=UPI003BB17843